MEGGRPGLEFTTTSKAHILNVLLTKERLSRLQIQVDSNMCELCEDSKEET